VIEYVIVGVKHEGTDLARHRADFRLVAFAGSIDTLADFALKARKPRTPLTPEQKAAAVAKAEATRAARHTMGPKQKAAIKGTVPATAPATQPAAPAPAPATPVTPPKA
jgi:hypothetical protein